MEFRGVPSNPNPVGSVGPGGQFFNPAATTVLTNNLLPPIPRAHLDNAPITTSLKALAFNAQAGARALAANNAAMVTQPSAPVVNSAPAAGSQGSTGNAGAPLALNPDGTNVSPATPGNPVAYGAALYGAALKSWQRQHPTISVMLRFGLPVGAILLWLRGNHLGGVALGGIAAILWVEQ